MIGGSARGPAGSAGSVGPAGPTGPTGPLSAIMFGDGSGGTVVFDGIATVLGMVPVANVYTMVADVVVQGMTVNVGVTLRSQNYRFFSRTAPIINGAVTCDGTAGLSDGTAGDGPMAGTIVGTPSNGGAGGLNAVAGGTVSGTDPTLGGAGGAGGAGGIGAGGVGGMAAYSPQNGTGRTVADIILYSLSTVTAFSFGVFESAGQGGGGGGGDATNHGGGGGGGGGMQEWWCPGVTNNGTVACRGGAGGSPTVGNTGGGGGGGGGVTKCIGGTFSNPPIVTGGAAGTKHGTGVNGIAGSVGTVVQIPA